MNPANKLPAVKGNASLNIVLVLAVGLILALFFGAAIGQGNYQKAYVILVILGGLVFFFSVGDSYWVFLPFAITAGLPAIPLFAKRSIDLGELWVIACVGAMLLRLGLRPRKVTVFRWDFIAVILYAFWVFIIYQRNPVGLAILGSSSFGGRWYLKIALAVAAFYVVVNQEATENQCKWLIRFILLGALVATVWGVIDMQYFSLVPVDYTQSFYTWHQSLVHLPEAVVVYLLARYSIMELMESDKWKYVFVILICYGLVLLSGKRAAVAVMLLYPMIAAVMRGKFTFTFLWGLGAALVIGAMAAGHGRLFELPRTAQRALVYLPGKWDSEVEAISSNLFRETLVDLAIKRIKQNPVVGEGYDLTISGFDRSAIGMEKGESLQAYFAAAGSSWHNTWLGIAADFGIPAAIIWAFVWIQMLRASWWVMKNTGRTDYAHILAAMIFILTIGSIFRSWTSGHSAMNLWDASWRFGALIAIKVRIELERAAAVARARTSDLTFTPALESSIR